MAESNVGVAPEFRIEEFPLRVAILDAGAQYVDMIKKACQRHGFPAEVVPIDTNYDELSLRCEAIIVSGGPASSHQEGSPMPDLRVWQGDIPTLNICYGMQAMALAHGGSVSTRDYGQDGRQPTKVDQSHPLFAGIRQETTALFTHGDFVDSAPEDFDIIGQHSALNGDQIISAIAKGIHVGVQFHPEVFDDTPQGYEIFANFFSGIAGMQPNPEFLANYMDQQIASKQAEIYQRVGETKHVIAFVSGGVDSVTAVALAAGVVPAEHLHMYYIDCGFMRDEDDNVIEMLRQAGFEVAIIQAEEQFEQATAEINGKKVGPLIEVVNPVHKRRIIGEKFVDIQNAIVASLDFEQNQVVLLQGTNAADRIESGHSKGGKKTAEIKEHHNQVQRVRDLNPIEPLDDLFKDEIRAMAVKLGLPEEIAYRQPFPGPGTALRILGLEEGGFSCHDEASQQTINKFIARMNIELGSNLSPLLLPVRSVGVGGDSRSHIAAVALEGHSSPEALAAITYNLTSQFRRLTNRVVYKLGGPGLYTIEPIATKPTREIRETLRHADRIAFEVMRAMGVIREIEQMPVILLPLGAKGARSIVIRPVTTKTHMTVQAMLPGVHLPREFYNEITTRILSEVNGISHVFLDTTNKPPATTEWE